MANSNSSVDRMADVLKAQEPKILADWMTEQLASGNRREDLIKDSDLRRESAEFLRLLREAKETGYSTNIQASEWSRVREMLASLSRSRALLGAGSYAPRRTFRITAGLTLSPICQR